MSLRYNCNLRYNRRFAAVCFGLAIALLSAGCSESEDEAKPSPNTAEPPTVVEQPASAEDDVRESPSTERPAEESGRVPATPEPAGRPPVMSAPPPEMSVPPPDDSPAEGGAMEPRSAPLPLLENYKVVLGADREIVFPGPPGELRVWIGGEDQAPAFPDDMVQDEADVPGVGQSAKVEPFAPAFRTVPESTQCISIHPSGSEVRFQLIAEEAGEFEVGANVLLYASFDCSGAPVPRTTTPLRVTVEVDRTALWLRKLGQLGEILWEQTLDFWGALVALVFGCILFLVRKKLKRWFGFGRDY